jgi:hypothetical protein
MVQINLLYFGNHFLKNRAGPRSVRALRGPSDTTKLVLAMTYRDPIKKQAFTRRYEHSEKRIAWRHKHRGVRRPHGVLILCALCGKSFPRINWSQKFCGECKPLADAFRMRKTGNKSAPRRIGDAYKCIGCAAEFVLTAPLQTYCCKECWWFNYYKRPTVNLSARMRAEINVSLRGSKNGRRWECLVGYTCTDLMAHLERQFTGRMSWNNIDKWEIDHIIPLALFQFDSAEHPEFKAAWALANLRPLWRGLNRVKRSKRLHLL